MLFPTLGKIATTDIVFIDINDSIQAAIKKMLSHGHRDIVVIGLKEYKIFTVEDILRARAKQIDFKNPLRELELVSVPVLNKHDSVLRTIELLNCDTEYICILNDEGSLYGIVSHTDIISSIDPETLMDNLCLVDFLKFSKRAKWIGKDIVTSELLCDMVRSSYESVIIIEEQKPIGIFTTKDIIRIIQSDQDLLKPISAYMSSPVDIVNAQCTVKEALEFLRDKHYKRVVAVDDEGRIAGVISQKELIATTYSKWALLTKEYQTELDEINTALVNKNKKYEEIASRDPLTNLYNRYKFSVLFESSHKVMTEMQNDMSLIIADIDHFKNINDTYGHNVGDAVLVKVSELLQRNLRDTDIIGRWGGEEFVILLPSLCLEKAVTIAEKLRKSIEEHTIDTVGKITVSFGVSLIGQGDNLKNAIERSDKALYKAKKLGRNRVVAADS